MRRTVVVRVREAVLPAPAGPMEAHRLEAGIHAALHGRLVKGDAPAAPAGNVDALAEVLAGHVRRALRGER